MLIAKLKTYPKHSQQAPYLPPTGPAPNNMPALIQENLYTSGSEYQLPDGTEYIGFYHVHPVTGAMVGATHISGPHESLTPFTPTIIDRDPSPGIPAPPPYVPTTDELLEYEKYIVSGSTYKSNLEFINSRDTKGNISLSESGSNQELLFESIADNYTNRSVVSAINTQFNYFKFPATITTEIQDIEFDESLLDIDVQAGISNDPYQGVLIRNRSSYEEGLYLVQGLGKRKFEIECRSIWALKNNLPPFANINGDIDGLDPGERNDVGTGSVFNNTFKDVSPGIFDGYNNIEPYTPIDAFAEGNIYGRIIVKLSRTTNNLPLSVDPTPNFYIDVNGSSFGNAKFGDINANTFDEGEFTYLRRIREAEFDLEEFIDSTIRIDSNLPSDNTYVGAFDEPFANYLFNTYGIDCTDGNSYFNFVQDAFIEYVQGNAPGWDIQQIATRGKKPKNFLGGLTSPNAPGNNNNWGQNVTYYKIKPGKLDEVDDKTRLYRLTIPIPAGAINNNTGYSYRIYKNTEDITDLLMTSTGERAIDYENTPANSGVPFQDSTSGFTNRGFTMDINQVFPNNEFIPNTTERLEIKIDTFQPSGTTIDLGFIFVGLNKWGSADSNSVGADVPTPKIKVVPNTIMLDTPSSGDQMWNSNTQDYNKNWDNVNNLKNWRGSDIGGSDYLVNDWTNGTAVKKVPNSNESFAGFVS